jgi:hypothetical protein
MEEWWGLWRPWKCLISLQLHLSLRAAQTPFATYAQEEPAGRLCGLRRAHFTLGAADYGNRAEQPHSGATRRSLGPPQHTVPTSGGPAREPGQLAGF